MESYLTYLKTDLISAMDKGLPDRVIKLKHNNLQKFEQSDVYIRRQEKELNVLSSTCLSQKILISELCQMNKKILSNQLRPIYNGVHNLVTEIMNEDDGC